MLGLILGIVVISLFVSMFFSYREYPDWLYVTSGIGAGAWLPFIFLMMFPDRDGLKQLVFVVMYILWVGLPCQVIAITGWVTYWIRK